MCYNMRCTTSLLSSLSANDLTARIKCTPSQATTPHPNVIASKRYISDSHRPRTLVKWWSKPLLPLITIIVVGIINETCDVKVIFNCRWHECHTSKSSIQHPKQMSLWQNNQQNTSLCHHAIWFLENLKIHCWTKYSSSSMCLTGSPLKGRCDSPSNYKSSQACGCRPERQREPTQKLQTTISFSLDQQCGFSDYPLP